MIGKWLDCLNRINDKSDKSPPSVGYVTFVLEKEQMDDIREAINERMAIMEYDGQLSCKEAERISYLHGQVFTQPVKTNLGSVVLHINHCDVQSHNDQN